MTTTPEPPRQIRLPADAYVDLVDGYLHTLIELDEGWRVGLIFGEGSNPEDEALAEQLFRLGTPMIDIETGQLAELGDGKPMEFTDSHGARYLITVMDVDLIEGLLDEINREE